MLSRYIGTLFFVSRNMHQVFHGSVPASSPFSPFAAIFLQCTAEVVRSGGGVFGCSLKTGVIPVGDLPWLWYAMVYMALLV